MAFPATLDDFTNRTDNVDDVLANDLNQTFGNGASNGGLEAVEAKLGVDSSAVATSIDYLLKSASSVDPGHSHSLLNNLAAAGNKMYWYANVAITGWTIVAVTDSVLAVKGGSNAYNVTGGQTGGTWTQPSHVLTQNEMPSHTHPIALGAYHTDSSFAKAGWGNNTSTGFATISATGGDASHSHGTTYRPLAAIGVICEKDA